MSKFSAIGGGEVIQTITDMVGYAVKYNKTVNPGSLIQATDVARVEPLCIVASDCVHLDFAPLVAQSLQSLFTGYYLQALALTTQVGDVKVAKVLDQLNPNRDWKMPAFESLQDIKTPIDKNWKLAKESYNWSLPTDEKKKDTMASVDSKSSKASQELVADMTNLSVGKLVNVTIKSGESQFTLPVSIRLMANQMPEQSVIQLMTIANQNNSFSERYHAWRAGRLSFIKDLILCQDLITEHKKALMKDKDNVYSEIIARSNKSKLAGLFSGDPSLAAASNLIICSKNTIAQVEDKLGGKFSNPKIRDKVFSTTYAMIIAVIDPQWERVTFYHRGIAAHTDMGIGDLKASNKGHGPEVSDILKAYIAGNAPSL